ELGQLGPQAAKVPAAGVSVDEPAQLGHGASWVAETMLRQLGQGEANANVVGGSEAVVAGAQVFQLGRGSLRLAQHAAKQRRPAKRGLGAGGGSLRALTVRLASGGVPPLGDQRLDGRVP